MRVPPARVLLVLLAALAALDLVAWGAHVAWRTREQARLAPLATQLDSLALRVAEDDAWIARNARLAQGYAQHAEYAERLVQRGRRARAHGVLVAQYNERIGQIYRRWYVAPWPAPPAPLRSPLEQPEAEPSPR